MGDTFFELLFGLVPTLVQLIVPIVIGLRGRKEATKVVEATCISIEINIEKPNTENSSQRKRWDEFKKHNRSTTPTKGFCVLPY
jgi:hypothetical protein